MYDPLRQATFRVIDQEGMTVGAGFVIDKSGLALSCLHVIEQVAEGDVHPVGDHHQFKISFVGAERTLDARIVGTFPSADPNNEDIAVLRIESSFPGHLQHLQLGPSTNSTSRDFISLGFPKQNPVGGALAYGRVLGEIASGNVHLLQLSSLQVTVGFSGAPVYDPLQRCVVGMISKIAAPDSYGRLGEAAFAIPSELLAQHCPSIELSASCPYVGLSPFAEEDTSRFFGRTTLIHDAFEVLATNPRCLILVGPSGSGKSSILHAGLVPGIRNGGVRGLGNNSTVITVSPGSAPTENLGAALVASGLAPKSIVSPWATIVSHCQELKDDRRLVCLFDQFEEVFAVAPQPEGEDFLRNLSSTLLDSRSFTAIIAIRADFYESLIGSPLATFLNHAQVNVGQPSSGELSDTVVRPAEAVGLRFESGLVDALVSDAMASPHSLPLLQFACTQLWYRRTGSLLTHESYRQIGFVAGSIVTWASDCFAQLGDDTKRKIARHVFLSLIHVDEADSRITRRRRTLAEIQGGFEGSAIREVVTRLAGARLLVTDWDYAQAGETIEIIHDAVIREWVELRGWIAEERDFLFWRQRLSQRMQESRSVRDDPSALLTGPILLEAEKWASAYASRLSSGELAFTRRSVDTRTAAIRKARLVRTVASVLAIVAVIVSSVGWYTAVVNKDKALQSRRDAVARYLLVEAGKLINDKPDLAALLMLEAGSLGADTASMETIQRLLSSGFVRVLDFHRGKVGTIAFNRGETLFVSASQEGDVALWDASTLEVLCAGRIDYSTASGKPIIGSAGFNGKTFYVDYAGGNGGNEQFWIIPSQEGVKTTPGDETEHPQCEEATADSQDDIPAPKEQRPIKTNGATVRAMTGFAREVWSFAKDRDGRFFLGTGDGDIVVWADRPGVLQKTGATSVAFSDDGEVLEIGQKKGSPKYFLTSSRAPFAKTEALRHGWTRRTYQTKHADPTNWVALDLKNSAISTDEGYILVDGIKKGTTIWVNKCQQCYFYSTALTTTWIFAGSCAIGNIYGDECSRGRVNVWKIEDILSDAEKEEESVDDDGTKFASVMTSVDAEIDGHDSAPVLLRISPDERFLASMSEDREMRLVDTKTWTLLYQTSALPSGAEGGDLKAVDDRQVGAWLEFSPSGHILTFIDRAGAARVITVDLFQLREKTCQVAHRNLTPSEWRNYIGDVKPFGKSCDSFPLVKEQEEEELSPGDVK